MSRKKEIDGTDVQILNILSQDASVSNRKLAKMIGLSPGPTLTRVANLKKRSIIGGVRAQINFARMGYHYNSYLKIMIHPSAQANFEEWVEQCAYILKCSMLDMPNMGPILVYMVTMVHYSEELFIAFMRSFTAKPTFGFSFEIIPIKSIVKDAVKIGQVD